MLFHQACQAPIETLSETDTNLPPILYWCPVCKEEVLDDTELYVSDAVSELEHMTKEKA